jgi:hypothetical protein
MKRPPKLRACIYCGTDKDLTRDHVPPRLFFAKPYPINLVTIPACHDCNQSFQANDEYTRYMVGTDMRSLKNRHAQSKLPDIIRSLQKTPAARFTTYLRNQTEYTRLLNLDGRPMGTSADLDSKRANATGERMVRAFTFAETGKPLPPTTFVRIGCGVGVTAHEPIVQQFAKLYSGFPDRRNQEFGEAFSYVAGFLPQGASIWLLVLYDHFVWIASVETDSV